MTTRSGSPQLSDTCTPCRKSGTWTKHDDAPVVVCPSVTVTSSCGQVCSGATSAPTFRTTTPFTVIISLNNCSRLNEPERTS